VAFGTRIVCYFYVGARLHVSGSFTKHPFSQLLFRLPHNDIFTWTDTLRRTLLLFACLCDTNESSWTL